MDKTAVLAVELKKLAGITSAKIFLMDALNTLSGSRARLASQQALKVSKPSTLEDLAVAQALQLRAEEATRGRDLARALLASGLVSTAGAAYLARKRD